MKKQTTTKGRFLSLLLAFALVFSGFTSFTPEAKAATNTKITIVHTNDTHGRVTSTPTNWGFAKIATKVKELKRTNPNTLVLDAGDTLHGMPILNISKGENAIKILDSVGYDAMALGNHDFNYGFKQLKTLHDASKVEMLAANVYDANGSNPFTPYIIKEMSGIKVAIFGLSTPETAFKTSPLNTKGLTFEDPVTSAQKMVKELSTKADIIIAIAHLGLEGDMTSLNLAAKVSGIDVIIDGHSHTKLPYGAINEVNGTLIAQTGEYDGNLGVIELDITDKKITKKSAQLLPVDEKITEDAAVASVIETIEEANKPIFAEVIGTTAIELDGLRENVRTKETNLGNLTADALKNVTGADIGFQNGGGIRTSIKAGDITKGDMSTVFPFGNTVKVIELSGKAILEALEVSVGAYPESLGGFLQISGITFTFDPTKEVGKRVVAANVGDKKLNVKKTYTVAMNDFTAAGGDNYTMFIGAKTVKEFGTLDDVFTTYIQSNGTKGCEVSGRCKIADPAIHFTAKTANLHVGKTFTFVAALQNLASGKITYTVSNTKIASINKTTGKLTAKKTGIITVTAKSGSYKVTQKVTIK